MKKLMVVVLAVVLVFGAVNVLGDHYRYELYQAAIDFEASKAKLEHKSGQFGAEQFAYLEGPNTPGQPSVILLHGFGASKENWLRFASYLTSSYHVIALDLAGHGENAQDLARTYRVSDQVEFVHQVTAAIGIERFYLVGNSMGGAISALYSASYPEQVLAAVLISPAGIHDIPSKMDELLQQGKNPLIAESVDDFAMLLDFAMEDKPFIPAPVAKVEAEKAMRRVAINKKIFTDLRSDMATGMESELNKIKAPVLIIWGREDRAINVANIDKYAAAIPNAHKLILDQIGHLAMIEVPERSAQAMLDFIAVNQSTN